MTVYTNTRQSLLPTAEEVGQTLERVVEAAGGFLVGLFSTLFISFFFLSDRRIIPRLLLFLSPESSNRPIMRAYVKSRHMLRRYIIGLLGQLSAFSTVVATVLLILDVPNAVFIAVLAGTLNIVPYIGPILGFASGLIIVTAEYLRNPIDALGMLVVKLGVAILAAQALDNFVLQPLIYSNSVKAHALEIFLVILMASTVAGVAGMVIAVPVYTVLRVVVSEFYRENALVATWTGGLSEPTSKS